jgi:proteasome accessory factor C
MTKQRVTAGEQLQRILHILPAAARPGGALIADLARDLGVTPERVLADLEEATARSYHHAGGTVEPFSIFADGQRVHVHAKHDFNRPVRLSQREGLALSLGLRALAAEAPAEERSDVTGLARRLEAALVAPAVLPQDGDSTAAAGGVAEDGVEYDRLDYSLALGDDGFRGVVADAVEQHVQCEVLYLKPGDAAPEQRRIAPYRLVYAGGAWYVAALDVRRDGLRFFRMDRVLRAALAAEPAPPPPADFADWLAAAPYAATDDVDVAIRYDARVARWVAERVAGAEPAEDGSVVVRHRVADARWVVRHVLGYGGAAVVVEPDEAVAWVRQGAGEVRQES